MRPFDGLPSGARSVPVPAPLLGELLEDIGDLAELKCALRFFWLLAGKHSPPRCVAATELEGDPVLLSALGGADAIRDGLGAAVERGVLFAAGGAANRVYFPNSPEGRRAAERFLPAPLAAAPLPGAPPAERPAVYRLYEENIGMLTAGVADLLRDAQDRYPEDWIRDAVGEAVKSNARSWRYVERVLERWEREGRDPDGKHRGHPQKVTAEEYLRLRG